MQLKVLVSLQNPEVQALLHGIKEELEKSEIRVESLMTHICLPLALVICDDC